MQPHKPASSEPSRPSDASTSAEPVKTEPTASKKPTLAAVLKDAEARLAETEKRIKPLTEPHPDPAAARNAEAPPVEVETQAAPSAEPHGNPVAAEDVEACQADAEKQPSAKPGIDLAAVLKDTEVRLAEAEKNVAEQADACLRAKAETENVRRRALEDITKASKFAAEKFAGTMLPVKDSLEAALAVGGQTPEKLREGVELTLRQLIAAFESANLVEENPLGQKFDPNKHNAIGMTESEAEPNTVLHVLQKGYLLHGRVIRPAMVMVAKAKKA